MIEYKELTTFNEFRECVSLQKEILGVSDLDAFSPLTLTVFAKREPPIGIIVGAFDKKFEIKKMIGFFFGTAVLHEKAIYGIAIGVLPEYQGKNIGIGIFLKFRDLVLERNVKYMYGLFDPLEGNLGHSYLNKLGFWGIRYKESPYELTNIDPSTSSIPIEKIAVKWELQSQRTSEKLGGTYQKEEFEKVKAKCPIVNEDNFLESKAVLVEIPEDFSVLKKIDFQGALNWRLKTRNIFNEYINNRGYWITEFYSHKENGKRRNFYLLQEKKHFENQCNDYGK